MCDVGHSGRNCSESSHSFSFFSFFCFRFSLTRSQESVKTTALDEANALVDTVSVTLDTMAPTALQVSISNTCSTILTLLFLLFADHCQGVTTLTGLSGSFTIHKTGSEYFPSWVCGWLYQTNSASRITIVLSEIQLWDYDWLRIWDGINRSGTRRLEWSDSFFPIPVIITSGDFYAEFSSNSVDQGTGFTAHWYSHGQWSFLVMRFSMNSEK